MKKLICILLAVGMLMACGLGVSAGAIDSPDEINELAVTRALKSGYVTSDGVNLRADHRLSAASLGLLYKNDTFFTDNVMVYQDALHWINVVMQKTSATLNTNYGWVAKDYVVVTG